MQLIIRNNHGFTWIELIVVIMILSILSAVVAGSLMSSDTELVARTEVIKTHLRYAQTRSMNSNTVWYIQLSSNSYSFFKKGEAASKLLPGGDSTTITLPSGMNITLNPSSDYVSFDDWGKPCTDKDAQIAQATDRILTVTDGSASRTITITKNTGFIQ